ncbi:MAG: CocE/NonD family hydrolase C-terminal non-catalytic domain-containing protein, partial [Solirubrobacterales bacterium]
IENGVTRHPRVRLYLADGGREDLAGGRYVRVNGRDWPIPGTRWKALALGADGSLAPGQPGPAATQAYASLPSIPTMSDVPTTGLIGAAGFNAFSNALPMLTEMNLAEPLGLTYTTKPFATDVLSAGPASLELRLATTAPETGIWAVVSDVAPDGTAHPMAVGRLSTAFPKVDRSRSLRGPRTGAIVEPYGVFDHKSPAAAGQDRLYRIEFWPIGNRFAAGHRLRLDIVGASAFSMPGLPAVNTVRVGAGTGSRLLLPVLPGSHLGAGLGR